MKPVIAIVGAGPGVGYAVAERFGREGFAVALLARNRDRTEGLVERLTAQDISAAGFEADIADADGLARALGQVKAHFGQIDVLEFGPGGQGPEMRQPRNIDVENARQYFGLHVLGAVAAVQAVLPEMLERKAGSLLFTTAPSAQRPLIWTASYGLVAGALLNYARLLNKDLAADGIYAGILAIAGFVVPIGGAPDPAFAAFPTVRAEDVADLHWRLHVERGEIEATIGDIERLYAMPSLR